MNPVRRFGGFDLYEKIGTGGMATVYRGIQRSLERQVVLKILHPHLSEDEHLLIRFEREARAAARLRHENVVQVIDCGREESTSYIAMEFVDGMDLKRFMETFGPPPIEMATLILRDICRGLEHAHQHRIIHRDVKPANLMLTSDGAIKIMDFGLARGGEDSVGMTATGAVLGTPAYMSPEQATGEHVDHRSDIFSVGVVGYEMFGGRRPFPGDSYASVLNAILTLSPEPLGTLNPNVPPEIAAVIHRMLEKDVANRYASITEVREELETIVERMGLVRGRDLLRRFATAPAAVTETLNGARGPGASLAASRAGAEVLTRADFRPLETRVFDDTTPRGGSAGSATRTAVDDATLVESFARSGPGSGGSDGGAARTAHEVHEEPPRSRRTIVLAAAGALVLASLAFLVIVFGGGGSRSDTFTITASADANGSITPSGSVLVADGADQTFRVSPDAHCHVAHVLVDGAPVDAVSEYTFTAVTANHTIEASFAIDTYTIMASVGANGSITPSGSVSATYGASQTFAIVPNAHYNVKDVMVDGVSVGAVSEYTFAAVSTNHTIEARFSIERGLPLSRKYLINSRPFALIYVDNGGRPVNADGKPVMVALKVGPHTFRAVNKDLDPPLDLTLRYDVQMHDPNNTIILNLDTRTVEPRRNDALPF